MDKGDLWSNAVDKLRTLAAGNSRSLQKDHKQPYMDLHASTMDGDTLRKVYIRYSKVDIYALGHLRPGDAHWWLTVKLSVPGGVYTGLKENYGGHLSATTLSVYDLHNAICGLATAGPKSGEANNYLLRFALYFSEPIRIEKMKKYMQPMMDSGDLETPPIEFKEEFKFWINNWGKLSTRGMACIRLGRAYFFDKVFGRQQLASLLEVYAIFTAPNEAKVSEAMKNILNDPEIDVEILELQGVYRRVYLECHFWNKAAFTDSFEYWSSKRHGTTLPYDSEKKKSRSVFVFATNFIELHVKGDVRDLLERCSLVDLRPGTQAVLDGETKNFILERLDKSKNPALGFAYKNLSDDVDFKSYVGNEDHPIHEYVVADPYFHRSFESNLTFLGFVRAPRSRKFK